MRFKILLLSVLTILSFSICQGQKKIKISVRNDLNVSYVVSGHFGPSSGGVQTFFSQTVPPSTTTWIELEVESLDVLLDLRFTYPNQTPVADFTTFGNSPIPLSLYHPSGTEEAKYIETTYPGPDIYYYFQLH